MPRGGIKGVKYGEHDRKCLPGCTCRRHTNCGGSPNGGRATLGKPKSAAHRRAISEAMLAGAGKIRWRDTAPERAFAALLDALGARYQHPVRIGQYLPDFLVEGELIVEINGCYWHSCPEHYPNEFPARIRQEARRLDELREHHDVLVVWEHDLRGWLY